MTIALEHIQPDDWAAVTRVTDTLRSLVIDTGGRSLGIRIGAVSIATVAATSATSVVAHGLGRVPAAVFVAPTNTFLVNALVDLSTATATNMTVTSGYSDNVARSFTATLVWLAIG